MSNKTNLQVSNDTKHLIIGTCDKGAGGIYCESNKKFKYFVQLLYDPTLPSVKVSTVNPSSPRTLRSTYRSR